MIYVDDQDEATLSGPLKSLPVGAYSGYVNGKFHSIFFVSPDGYILTLTDDESSFEGDRIEKDDNMDNVLALDIEILRKAQR